MRPTILRVLVLVALAVFYLVGATAHAKRVNTSKARGDQSGYLWDGQNVQANWHGLKPSILIGQRNRMPVYAGFLALMWSPAISNDDFFEKAKVWNIYLSLGLLAILAAILAYYLPPLPATNLTLIVAFGWFIFKAGYVQADLLFYVFFFIAFLLFVELLARPKGLRPDARPPRASRILAIAAAAGGIAALAHLTKAALLPLVGVFLTCSVADAVIRLPRQPGLSLQKLSVALVVGAAFLLVLSPYIRTNKRVFGQYFYNVNTTFYMWYDDWPQASIGTIQHGDAVGWPTMPDEGLPSASRYWREHTVGQIAGRIGNGLWDMVDRSYKTYWYFKYLVLYLGLALALIRARPGRTAALIRRFPAVFGFLALYGLVYLIGIAFYAPVSGTGTARFLTAHLLPLFFVLSLLFTLDPFRAVEWRLAGTTFGVRHFHLLVSLSLAFDIVFVIWPRLMTTYGGF